MSANKTSLAELEATLLATLSAATGNILDNAALITTLEEAKGKAVEITEKLAKARVTAEEIEEVRVKYIPVADRGAVLFFVMAGLSAISSMYEYSLAAFLTVFGMSLAGAKRDPLLPARLRNVLETLTADVYNYTCLGLFEKHKLLLSFQMTVRILQAEGKVEQRQLDFFLKGGYRPQRAVGSNRTWAIRVHHTLFVKRNRLCCLTLDGSKVCFSMVAEWSHTRGRMSITRK